MRERTMDIAGYLVKANDTIHMIITGDVHVDYTVTDWNKDEVTIVGRFLDADGDVTRREFKTVDPAETIFTVSRV
jgi:hypothetical protein